MGFGASLLGHASRVVQKAMSDQQHAGWNFGFPGADQLKLAKLLREAGTANERILLCASGSDAAVLAMRLARAFTNRDTVAVFAGSYHGVHDYALIAPHPENGTDKSHIGLGIPSAIDSLVAPLTYGSRAALSHLEATPDVPAAVIVEAVQPSQPGATNAAWLTELQDVCRRRGIVFILDECNTGFRLAYGGAQAVFGLAPDLVLYGDSVASGLPFGALAGKSHLMRLFASDNGEAAVFAGSSGAGNGLAVSCAIATLSHLFDRRQQFYADLERSAECLSDRINQYWMNANLPFRIDRYGSILKLCVAHPGDALPGLRGDALDDATDVFFVHLLDCGVMVHASRVMYLSAAHTESEIDSIVEAFISASEQTAADGFF